ncbi:hypothetical protein [Facilibium subflavum]|uniref:hypothetical protein n=1 Tax=Facilibium subflavum TaxID=2219058 RepID=UPI000E653F60|nr:hypothetical protein [Facilibium subflavum]
MKLKYNNKKVMILLGLSMLASMAFGREIKMTAEVKGIYHVVYLAGVNADRLQVKKGDRVLIQTPKSTRVSSAWGSMMLEHCRYKGNLAKEEKTAKTICYVQSIIPWRHGLNIGIQALDEAMSGEATIVIDKLNA